MASKKFVLITPGRAASTALMKVLESFDDIAVPNKNIDCSNNELVQQRHVKKYRQLYSELTNFNIKTNQELIDQFFLHNDNVPYAGFKTMPLRHKNDTGFLKRQDIQFIVLTRDDIPSTVASFIMARKRNTWARRGGKSDQKIVINGIDILMVWGNSLYVRRSMKALKDIDRVIQIKYEDLCQSEFDNPGLNRYFGREIRLENPVRPTSGVDYIENWVWFKKFVERWST